jgi:hypothetical protein
MSSSGHLRSGLLLLALALGCATSPPAVRPDQTAPIPGGAIVMGAVRIKPWDPGPNDQRGVALERKIDGKWFAIDLDNGLTMDAGPTVPFFVNVPAGTYRLAEYSYSAYIGQIHQTPPPEQLVLGAGDLVCIGTLEVVVSYRLDATYLNIRKHECGAIVERLRRLAPKLALQPAAVRISPSAAPR